MLKKNNAKDNNPINSISTKQKPEEKLTIFYPKTPFRGKVKISFDNQGFSFKDLIRIYPKLNKNNNYVYYNPIKDNNNNNNKNGENNNNNNRDIDSNCNYKSTKEFTLPSTTTSLYGPPKVSADNNTTRVSITTPISPTTTGTVTTTPISSYNINSIGQQLLLNEETNKTHIVTTPKTMRFEVNLKSLEGNVDYKELVKNHIKEQNKEIINGSFYRAPGVSGNLKKRFHVEKESTSQLKLKNNQTQVNDKIKVINTLGAVINFNDYSFIDGEYMSIPPNLKFSYSANITNQTNRKIIVIISLILVLILLFFIF
ncbi:hypothetical protein ACTA71_007971 [Dictyostelium dimigraforme]